MLGSEGELKHVTEGMTQSLIYISTGFGLHVVYTSAKKPLRYKKYSDYQKFVGVARRLYWNTRKQDYERRTNLRKYNTSLVKRTDNQVESEFG